MYLGFELKVRLKKTTHLNMSLCPLGSCGGHFSPFSQSQPLLHLCLLCFLVFLSPWSLSSNLLSLSVPDSVSVVFDN